jgi:hypothetical protein
MKYLLALIMLMISLNFLKALNMDLQIRPRGMKFNFPSTPYFDGADIDVDMGQ